jgi:CubicO group peptidase (beta-lactamase class C family)
MGRLPIIMLIGLCIIPTIPSRASDNELEAKIDKIFEKWNKSNIPGAAVAVVKDGKPLLIKGYGCADLEHGTPITPQTIFNAASLAKQFTAFSVLMLETQGKLSLDDEVRMRIREFPDFGHKINLRHLLYHTSGLRDWGGLILMSGGRMDNVFSSHELLKLIFRQQELNFDPGTEFTYCNVGYLILAEIVSRTCGQSFKEWTRENIFVPLGMENTTFKDNVQEVMPGVAHSYGHSGNDHYCRSLDNEAAPGPGSLFISMKDIARWMAILQTKAFGSPEIWSKMVERGKLTNGQALPYAAGLIMGNYKSLPTLHHSGSWAGYRSDMVYFPEQRFSVAVLANNSSIFPTLLTPRIADICLEGQFPSSKPAQTPMVEVNTDLLDAYVGRYWLRGEQMLMIKRKENELFAQMSGDLPVKIFPESEDTFAYRIISARIQFHRSGSSKPHKITFWQEAVALPAERLLNEGWMPSDPAEFCGRYYVSVR